MPAEFRLEKLIDLKILIQGVHRDADKSKRLFKEEKIIRY